MYSSILILRNIWYYNFTWKGPNLQKIVNLFQFCSGPRGPTVATKFILFLWIWSTSGKMMMSYVFKHEIRGIHRIWAYWHCSSKIQVYFIKYTTWVPWDPTPSCFCNVMSFFEGNIQIFWTKLLHLSILLSIYFCSSPTTLFMQ